MPIFLHLRYITSWLNNDVRVIFLSPSAVQRTAECVLKEIFPCLVACGLVDDNMDAYTMQISGERSYIAGNHDLIEFKDIRRCVSSRYRLLSHLCVIVVHRNNDVA